MYTIEAKLGAMLVTALGSLIGIIPAYLTLTTRTKRPILLSSIPCIGAGALMSAALFNTINYTTIETLQYIRYCEIFFCFVSLLLFVLDETCRCLCCRVTDTPPLIYEATENNSLLNSPSNNQRAVTIETAPFGISTLSTSLRLQVTLEGFAIGLQVTFSQVLVILTVLFIYRFVLIFYLGLEIKAIGLSKTDHALKIFQLACDSIASILLGMLIFGLFNETSGLCFILLFFASGSLLYIAMGEILTREGAQWFQPNRRVLVRFIHTICILVGFTAMTEGIYWIVYTRTFTIDN